MSDASLGDASDWIPDPDVGHLQCLAMLLKERIPKWKTTLENCPCMQSFMIQRLTKGGIRVSFRNLAGNEIAPAGMQCGCPADWTVSQVLENPRWIQLGNSSEHGFTKLEKRFARGHMDGYKVLEKNDLSWRGGDHR